MSLVRELALVAAGGAIGASCRHLVGVAAFKLIGPGFPFGTLIANVVGCFAMGVLVEMLALKFHAGQEIRLFLATGLLGGFTTFSAFSLDFATLVERGHAVQAGSYLLASVFLSILALFAGLHLTRSILVA
ncbi:MAG: fluoride efflux transporter CrcB [Pseudomonadota bacterium]